MSSTEQRMFERAGTPNRAAHYRNADGALVPFFGLGFSVVALVLPFSPVAAAVALGVTALVVLIARSMLADADERELARIKGEISDRRKTASDDTVEAETA